MREEWDGCGRGRIWGCQARGSPKEFFLVDVAREARHINQETQQSSLGELLVFCQGSFEGSQTPQNFLEFNFELRDIPQLKIGRC